MKRGERCCCLISTRNSNSSTATKNRGIISTSGRAGQPRGRELLQQPLGNQQFAPRQLIENGSIQMEASLPASGVPAVLAPFFLFLFLLLIPIDHICLSVCLFVCLTVSVSLSISILFCFSCCACYRLQNAAAAERSRE